jgi:chorismate-pyruvate lyase
MINLSEVLRQDSVTAALTQIYGPVQLQVLSQSPVHGVAAPYEDFFGPVRTVLLERRIRLMVRSNDDALAPVVSAISWIRIESLSLAARDELQRGRRMLGEILAAEGNLVMHDYGLDTGRSADVCRELFLPEDTDLVFRWRYWSKASGERAVLLRECGPAMTFEPYAAKRGEVGTLAG